MKEYDISEVDESDIKKIIHLSLDNQENILRTMALKEWLDDIGYLKTGNVK